MLSIFFNRFDKKRRYRACCYNELTRIGYRSLVLYFEKLLDTYDSYWGDGDKRIEVQYDPSTGAFWANEFEAVKINQQA